MGYRACDVGACSTSPPTTSAWAASTRSSSSPRSSGSWSRSRPTRAVLNADDELCLRMADYTKAKHLCYVTMNPRHPLVREHIRAGGRAVVLEEGMNGQHDHALRHAAATSRCCGRT